MIAWIAESVVASALLMAVVLALRAPVARTFGTRAAYALWALPALRLFLPSLPGWRGLFVPVFHIGPEHSVVGLVEPAEAARLAADVPLPYPPAPAVDWPIALLALWLAGALLWFGWQMLRYRLFLARALAAATLLTRECGVDVLVTPHVDGPVAAGILRKRIFLPLDFLTRYAPAERRLALLHEGAHHDRGDLLANLAALGVLALHWFNPLAHLAYRRFRADQELACDATVLADIGMAERHAYGSALLKSASARMPGVACALSHKEELKRRLRTMARPGSGVARTWAGLGVVAIAAGIGLVATASGQERPMPLHSVAPTAPVAPLRPALPVAPVAPVAPPAPLPPPADAGPSTRDMAAVRTDADADRQEALRDADEARREAAQDRAEAMREAAAARAEAARARAEAMRDRANALRDRDASGEGQRQIAITRTAMAARCAARGRPVSADLDWERLALCGDTGAGIAARIQAEVGRTLAPRGVARD